VTPEVSGGCLCGQLRYRCQHSLDDAGYCHCRLCQRASAAPFTLWVTVPAAAFVYTRGEPKSYASTPGHQREFCSQCGTPLVFRSAGSATVDFTALSLDRPQLVRPKYHIWTASRWGNGEADDGLPSYCDNGPDEALGAQP
jgi:hypothetical protein